MFKHLAHESAVVQRPLVSHRSLLMIEASTALARLDERLAAAPDAVRAGWISRALVCEAAASLRLDGFHASSHDLLLILNNSLNRTPDQDLGRAMNIHSMLLALHRRNPRHLFSARKIATITQLRLRGSQEQPSLPAWLQNRLYSAETMHEALAEALNPSSVNFWKTLPSLEAGAHIIAHWHASGAADCIGGAPSRALAMAWTHKAGLTSNYYLLPSVGFLGHASEYRPDIHGSWLDQFLKACIRSADWGFKLHGHLSSAYRRLQETAPCERSTSHMTALIELLMATPVLSAATAGQTLHITSHAARAMLTTLENKGLIHEITGRRSFRLYTAAPLIHLRAQSS